MKQLSIATRGSKLALWQAEHIQAELKKLYPNLEVLICTHKTKGDKILDVPLAKIGGKGLFTKELEEAMLRDESDLAVHSLKDVPTQFEHGFILTAVTTREDVRDAMLSQKYQNLDELPKNAVVGTTSLRRRMQLLRDRPDLKIKDLRGNLQTRIQKLKDGVYDAIILATAGINRLGIENEVKYFSPIDTKRMIPAMGQAVLGIEIKNNSELIELLRPLNDKKSEIETTIEREFVDTLQGGCQVPIGIYANLLDSDKIEISAIVGMPDGSEMIEKHTLIDKDRYKTFGKEFAKEFIKDGAKELLRRASKIAF